MAARKPAPADDWAFAPFPEIAARFGLSLDALTILTKEKDFPQFSRKICPELMKEWLRANAMKMREMAVK